MHGPLSMGIVSETKNVARIKLYQALRFMDARKLRLVATLFANREETFLRIDSCSHKFQERADSIIKSHSKDINICALIVCYLS